MRLTNTEYAFFVLLNAGLWEQKVSFSQFDSVDFEEVWRLAEEQSVTGLIAAGVEHIEERKPFKKSVMPFLAQVLVTEQKNQAMNDFIAGLMGQLRGAGVYALLVKGQGIAQCYARPLWRTAGDVDLFFDSENYEKAKVFFQSLSYSLKQEGLYSKHIGFSIDSWEVELHGTMRCGLSSRMDKALDAIQEDTFVWNHVRIWKNGGTDVPLPSADNDTLFIFTHFLKHFYKGGIGLRQICDWCRLLWTFRDSIDTDLLSSRLRKMRLTSEWKAFGAFAVDYLGMPAEAMPLYDCSPRWSRKARRIHAFILEVGNFGHNRDMSYYKKYPYVVRKTISAWQRLSDLCRHALIFPLDSLRFFPKIMSNGLRSAARGE